MIGFVDDYRAKTVDHSRWVYGTFCQRVCDDNNVIIPCISVIHENDYGDWIESAEIDGNTVGKDTHIFDANGNHLYEGDIVQFKNPRGKLSELYNYIIELDNHNGFVGHTNDHRFYINENDVRNKCVRVGNIFDNPEMVGGDITIPEGVTTCSGMECKLRPLNDTDTVPEKYEYAMKHLEQEE